MKEGGSIILGSLIIAVALIFGLGFSIAVIDGQQFESLQLHPTEFYYDVSSGHYDNLSSISKFGATLLDTTIRPLTLSTHYRTPTSAVQLQVVSDDAQDSSTGTGARKVTIIGLNASWEEVVQEVTMNGLTPVQIPIPLTRVYRWYVSESGTYATETTGSHAGQLLIEETTGGADWTILTVTPYPVGQSQISVYTIPKGKKGYLLSKTIFVDSTKSADIYFFKRDNVNDTTVPFSPMRLVEREVGVSGGYGLVLEEPTFLCEGPCDVGFMGLISVGTASASAEFELLLVDI